MIWTSASKTEIAFESEILPSVLADHNPMMLTINKRRRTGIWRMDVNHLKDKNSLEHAKKEME